MNINKYYLIGKEKLYPLCRSLTGPGTKKTLQIIKNEFKNLKIKKDKSGKKVFDWKIPPEWIIKDAFVKDKNNKRIIDFKLNNLHLVSYSIPINKYLTKTKLFKKLNTLKKYPSAIPYLTSYYRRNWGFCITENFKKKIDKTYSKKDKFHVKIESKLDKKGYLHYGELFIKGKSSQEILISTYICHPSMANNELSGPIVSMCLINYFKKKN